MMPGLQIENIGKCNSVNNNESTFAAILKIKKNFSPLSNQIVAQSSEKSASSEDEYVMDKETLTTTTTTLASHLAIKEDNDQVV